MTVDLTLPGERDVDDDVDVGVDTSIDDAWVDGGNYIWEIDVSASDGFYAVGYPDDPETAEATGSFEDETHDPLYEAIDYTVTAYGDTPSCPVDGENIGEVDPAWRYPVWIQRASTSSGAFSSCPYCASTLETDTMQVCSQYEGAGANGCDPVPSVVIHEHFSNGSGATYPCDSPLADSDFPATDGNGEFQDFFGMCGLACCITSCHITGDQEYQWGTSTLECGNWSVDLQCNSSNSVSHTGGCY